jgi:hypothetical protein
MRSNAAHRAVTDRRLFQPVDDLAGLVRAVDMRHYDAERAIVKRPRGDRIFAIGHGRNRCNAGVERGIRRALSIGAPQRRSSTWVPRIMASRQQRGIYAATS